MLISVHAFATDPARGVFVLTFLTLCIGGALTLYAWRAPKLGSSAGFELWSRESFLLFNNVLLVIAAALILLGTLYPLFMDGLNWQDFRGAAVFSGSVPGANAAAPGPAGSRDACLMETSPPGRSEAAVAARPARGVCRRARDFALGLRSHYDVGAGRIYRRPVDHLLITP